MGVLSTPRPFRVRRDTAHRASTNIRPLCNREGQCFNPTSDLNAFQILFCFQVVSRLKIHPKCCRRAKIFFKTKRRIRTYATKPMNNFINATRRDANIHRKSILRHIEWRQKFFEKNLAWMNRLKFFCHTLLMIIGYFHIKRASILPSKTNSPLIVDTNAVLTKSVSI